MATTELTPLQQQYYDLKAKHPDALLLFRMGDFYETYNEDAEDASRILGITLTKRSSTGQRMAGFPHHALDQYLPKLIRAGKRVAIHDYDKDYKTKSTNNNSNNMETTTTPNPTTPNENATETKTPMMYPVLVNFTKYVHFAGKLTATTIKSVTYDFKNESFTINANCGGKDKEVLINRDNIDNLRNLGVYDSENDYRANSKSSFIINELTADAMLKYYIDRYKYRHIKTGDKGSYFLIWNGKASEKWYLADHISTLTVENGVAVMPDTLPSKLDIYTDLAELRKWNDITVVDDKGNEEVKESRCGKFRLSAEQQKKWDKAVKALQDAKDAGISLIFDTDDAVLYGVNADAYEELSCEYGGDTEYENRNEIFAHVPYTNLVHGAWCEDVFVIKSNED